VKFNPYLPVGDRRIAPAPRFAGSAPQAQDPRFGGDGFWNNCGFGPPASIPQYSMSCAPLNLADINNPATPTGAAYAYAMLLRDLKDLPPRIQQQFLDGRTVQEMDRGQLIPVGIGTGCRLVPPGLQATIKMEIDTDMMLWSIVIPEGTCDVFDVVEIRVGRECLLGGTGDIPGCMFREDAVGGQGIRTHMLRPGQKLKITVKNTLPSALVNGVETNARAFKAGAWFKEGPEEFRRFSPCV